MRYDKLIRFLVVVFSVGAVFGLVGGLAFGGEQGPVTAPGAAATKGAPSTTQAPPAITAERAKAIGSNELGQIMVLMYHRIATPETDYTRSPQHFREDLQLLKANGYYPVNVRELIEGTMEVPAGKSPVVLTFDDSSPGQYRLLADGRIDPDSAVGIIQAEVAKGGWAQKATFNALLDVRPADHVVFGQPEKKREKLQNLVAWGYEVGSHTVSHLDLKKASRQESVKQLAQSQTMLEEMIGGGYDVTTLAVPFGEYPSEDSILAGGEYESRPYAYKATLAVGGGSSASPFTDEFRRLHVSRIEVVDSSLSEVVEFFNAHPELRYISDGDPMTVSAPKALDAELGQPLADLGRPLVRY